MYQAITEEDRTELATALYNQVLKDSWDERKEKNGEYLVCYCKIQDAAFTTEMTENEIKTSARLTIDILEELKNINNTGLNKEKFNTLLKQYTTENAGITEVHFFFFGLGAGNSSYIALNKPVRNVLLSASSTNNISFAPLYGNS